MKRFVLYFALIIVCLTLSSTHLQSKPQVDIVTVSAKAGSPMTAKELQQVNPASFVLASKLTEIPITSTPIVSANASSGFVSNSLASWLLALRTCESSNNYQENTGNGFYGAYQFTISTWDSLNTGYTRADLAPPAVQDSAIVQNTLRTSGLSSQNPGCYISTGISNYPPN